MSKAFATPIDEIPEAHLLVRGWAEEISISEIEPYLFLGSYKASLWVPLLKKHGITSVVSVDDLGSTRWHSPHYTVVVPREDHLEILCLDSNTQDMLVHLGRICDFIDQQLEPREKVAAEGETSDRRVFIHCRKGVSRAATVTIAYLMRRRREPLDTVLKFVKERRRIRPNPNFMEQLRVWEEVEYEIWEDEEKKIPKPAYAAYLEGRAVRLKAKGLTGDEPVGIVSLD